MSERLTGFRVAILATDLFEEAELFEPRKALVEERSYNNRHRPPRR